MSFEREMQKAFLNYTRGDGRKADKLAAMLGISASYLYRCCSENDPAAGLKLANFYPFLDITKQYGPLKWLCRQFGFILVKLPTRTTIGPKTVAELQKVFLDCQTALIDFNSGAVGSSETQNAIDKTIEALVHLGKQIERGNELALEEKQKCLPLEDN